MTRLKNGVSNDREALEGLTVVQQRGVDPTGKAGEAVDLLDDYQDRLKYLVRRHREYYAAGGDLTAAAEDDK